MLQVSETYSVKHLSNGAGRIYIKNSSQLRRVGYVSGAAFDVLDYRDGFKLELKPDGERAVMNTSRGELIELRNKTVGTKLKGVERVTVTFSEGILLITIPINEAKRIARELSAKKALDNGTPLRKASLCSGLGMTAYHLARGMQEQGIEVEMAYSVDNDKLAVALQVEGNPIWENKTDDAQAFAMDMRQVPLSTLNPVHIVEVGYPCVGQSTLCPPDKRDLDHPIAGTLFCSLISMLVQLNPVLVVIENTPLFISSQTLSIMSRELKEYGYRVESTKISGYENGDFEIRERACVTIISDGLPPLRPELFQAPMSVERQCFNDIREDVPLDSWRWSKMEHVTKKQHNPKLNFKHNLLFGDEDQVATLTANYASPRISSAMVAHPEYAENGLQRLITPLEHSRIREVPKSLWKVLADVISGKHPLVSSRGNSTHVQRMLGNGSSPRAWFNFGGFLGKYFNSIRDNVTRLTVEQVA
ncbi:DNA cytosine methyltransferase [Vibrio coralliilyticus]|uniref:DNA cytosine methyltransferase n=1 Tax=Vibrio coralliilyticus TaxID=190893 RepID=UPI001E30D373|nr:DNA cytosine methyltransferase [Vibrio coralliilyticus]MCC2525581.1 DNA cytosine methyltransferase [Vibrio coralliilyticus]